MNELRKPFLLVAIIMFALVVLVVSLGSSLAIGGGPADDGMSSQEAKMDITVNGEVDEPSRAGHHLPGAGRR